MPRDFDQIAAAAAYINNSQTADETTSLPPGYISGFYAKLEQDFTVTISPGTIYVAGRAVKMENEYLLAGSDWVAPRLDHPNHYYIYVDKGGAFRVDLVAPVFNQGYNYYEQPDYGWRVIAKIFVKNNDIIYCSWDTSGKDSTVTVAPLGYTGEADYFCTGTNDDVLINAAILYVSTAYGGGTVKLLEGSFETGSSVNMSYSYVHFEGSGSGTIITPNGQSACISANPSTMIYDISVSDIKIIDSAITAYGATTAAIYYNYVTRGRIERVTVVDFFSAIRIHINSEEITVKDCVADGNSSTKAGNVAAIVAAGAGRNILTNNKIVNIRSSGQIYGFYLVSSGTQQVLGNSVYDFSTSGAGSLCCGIYLSGCDYSIVSNNRIESCINSGTATNAYGIRIDTSLGTNASVSVTANYCYNNGSDSGIANTNSNNFYDAGTDTQVYSNSWQTPVSGEPSLGEFHKLATAPTADWWWSTAATTVITSVTNSYLPVGAKGIEMFVVLNADYNYLMTSASSTCTCTGAYLNMTAYNNDAANIIGFRVPIAVDSGRKFYFRAWNLGASSGGAGSTVFFSPLGYFC